MSPNNAEALLIDATVGRHQNRWDASLANLQRASELDPRNGEVAYRLEQIYFEMRRYSELEQFIRKQAASGGPRVGALEDPFNWLARMKLAQGDPVAAQSLLEQLPVEYSPGEWTWTHDIRPPFYLRDYDAANRVIPLTPANFADEDWAYGQVARARGDKQKAQSAFAAARKKVDTTRGDKPQDADYFAQISGLDAGLGRKEEAISEARRAVEIEPIAKDAVNGPTIVADLGAGLPRGRARRDARSSNSNCRDPSRIWPDMAAISVSIRAGMICAVTTRFDKIVAAAKAASR